jgi:hypothetical protein
MEMDLGLIDHNSFTLLETLKCYIVLEIVTVTGKTMSSQEVQILYTLRIILLPIIIVELTLWEIPQFSPTMELELYSGTIV